MKAVPRDQRVTTVMDVEIGLEESAVVWVESGEVTGYLIAKGYTIGEPPSEIALEQVLYLGAVPGWRQATVLEKVLVSGANGCWAAVDLSTVSLVPCPSRKPYPILFISKHGFHWMEEMIHKRSAVRVLNHLREQFAGLSFRTDRRILAEEDSSFRNISCLEAALFERAGSRKSPDS